jgi:2-(1,2-epoxy-1,2-dihydrophenyl)acetyl-CoA isomerase
MSNTAHPLLVEDREGVRFLTLNRPERRNALNRELVLALGPALENAGQDPAVRVIVLGGTGGAFCSGADLRSGAEENADIVADFEARMGEFHRMIRGIARAPKPVIAAVDGGAVGYGCDLALACDLRILSTRAYLQEKFVKIGLMPDGGGTFFLPRLIGTARAMEYVLTGAPIDAAKANELGITNRVVPPEKLAGEVWELARELAKGPPIAFAEIKRAMIEAWGGGLDAALDREKAGQARCFRSGDAMEGVLAWMQKREPTFRGM